MDTFTSGIEKIIRLARDCVRLLVQKGAYCLAVCEAASRTISGVRCRGFGGERRDWGGKARENGAKEQQLQRALFRVTV